MKPKRNVPKIGFPSDYKNLNETHEKILKLSENLVGTKGVFGLELKSIASSLNVSPSLIHHYYKNAEVLIFDRKITNEEASSVMAYLIKKYNIKAL